MRRTRGNTGRLCHDGVAFSGKGDVRTAVWSPSCQLKQVLIESVGWSAAFVSAVGERWIWIWWPVA